MRHDEFERAVNVTQWLLGWLSNPEHEPQLRSLMGNGPTQGIVVHQELREAAEQYGVQESELGSAIKHIAQAF